MFLYLCNVKGFGWNHKRVYRIYCELALNLRIKPKRRIKRKKPEALVVPQQANQIWSMDFMSDSLADGRSLRAFNLLDDYNREGLALEIDLSLPSKRVIRLIIMLYLSIVQLFNIIYILRMSVINYRRFNLLDRVQQ